MTDEIEQRVVLTLEDGGIGPSVPARFEELVRIELSPAYAQIVVNGITACCELARSRSVEPLVEQSASLNDAPCSALPKVGKPFSG